MNNKKKKIIILICIFILLIIMALGFILFRNYRYKKFNNIIKIDFEITSNFIDDFDTTITISIDNDGRVLFINDFDDNLIEDFTISKDKFNTLKKVVTKNYMIFDKNDISLYECKDYDYKKLTIWIDNYKYYSIGDKCITDKGFLDIYDSIIESVGKNRYSEYIEKIDNYDKKTT